MHGQLVRNGYAGGLYKSVIDGCFTVVDGHDLTDGGGGLAGKCGLPERGGAAGSLSESVDARKVAPPHSAVSRPTRRRNYVCAEATDRPLTP